MFKRVSVLIAFVVLAGAMASVAAEISRASDADKKPVTNKRCPVMNADASEKYRTEYKGQFVYFCCAGCVRMFEKEPETHIAKLSKEDQEAIKPNTICPITEDPIADHEIWVEHEGRKVYLCCAGCEDMFRAKMAEKK